MMNNDWDVEYHRRAMDRERKRLVAEREQRMKGDRRTQHIRNAILKRLGRKTK
jgi:hypothetical protein